MFDLGSLVGATIGGALFGFLFGLLWGKLFKSLQPDGRALLAAVFGWLSVGLLASWGYSDGGSLQFSAALMYVPGALIAYFFLRRRYRESWVSDED